MLETLALRVGVLLFRALAAEDLAWAEDVPACEVAFCFVREAEARAEASRRGRPDSSSANTMKMSTRWEKRVVLNTGELRFRLRREPFELRRQARGNGSRQGKQAREGICCIGLSEFFLRVSREVLERIV